LENFQLWAKAKMVMDTLWAEYCKWAFVTEGLQNYFEIVQRVFEILSAYFQKGPQYNLTQAQQVSGPSLFFVVNCT
jgi:hypothetical protein